MIPVSRFSSFLKNSIVKYYSVLLTSRNRPTSMIKARLEEIIDRGSYHLLFDSFEKLSV